jgi:2,5-dioxopentanoate dehydrogenase
LIQVDYNLYKNEFTMSTITTTNPEFTKSVVEASSQEEVNRAVDMAKQAVPNLQKRTLEERTYFLQQIIVELEKEKEKIVAKAMQETNLTQPRMENEFLRTCNQIRAFVTLLKEGSWVNACIDRPINPDGSVRLDLRKSVTALGPVVVFSASNFPLAFSVAGGDSISAFAAGCPVIVKAHNGHTGTSTLVASCILRAGKTACMPEGFFSIVYGRGFETGMTLVKHPGVKAVGFTGSIAGGTAIMQAAQNRTEPIPVFAEMGSINPVVILPKQMAFKKKNLATQLGGSITMGSGQFCTKPGLIIAFEDENLDEFIDLLNKEMNSLNLHGLLHQGITKAYEQGIESLTDVSGDFELKAANNEGTKAYTGVVSAELFLENDLLNEEVFGPYALIVKCKSKEQMEVVLNQLNGQLTGTVMAQLDELNEFQRVIEILTDKVGRLIFNGVPTGVEVCTSMHHGGPFPSCSTPHFTSVGTDAIHRFVRPISYQEWPEELLPIELKSGNPSNIWRTVNGVKTKSPL